MMDANEFAAAWEAGWNSHDLDRILAHYHPGIVFRSSKAQALVGQGTLHGQAALRAYWAKALEWQPDLKFTVVDVYEGHNMLVITYRNHAGVLAAETLRFEDAQVVEASACHRKETT
ncbi:MAG: nuclear transport factor 2 family protein [Pseudomonadota bacterium]